MDTIITEIANLIGTMGFPIVACVYMWKYINTTLKDFTNTMNKNTNMLSKLCDRLERMEKDENDRKNNSEN